MSRIERLQVTNHERWGKLVKTWATGNNYLDDDNEYPLPTTMDEFKEQLAKAQVFATVPERFKQIQFVSSDQETILVRLPPKVMIADSRPCSMSRARPIRFRRSTSGYSTAWTR